MASARSPFLRSSRSLQIPRPSNSYRRLEGLVEIELVLLGELAHVGMVERGEPSVLHRHLPVDEDRRRKVHAVQMDLRLHARGLRAPVLGVEVGAAADRAVHDAGMA